MNVRRPSAAVPLVFLILALAPAFGSAQPAPPAAGSGVAGIDGFREVSDAVILAGNVSPSAMKDLAGRGVSTVISLRASDEVGYDDAAASAAARSAGLRWVEAPLIADAPEASTLDRVLAELEAAKARKTVVFCKSGQRASVIWFAERVLIDGVGRDKAMAEAASLGLVRADLKAFALSYVEQRSSRRPPQ
jgi:uncharacterized protein (TIGR01244 family)